MSTARSPLISVCIPTYQGEATLAAAIESVLMQTEPDFELIVIDDGSPDDTRAVVERFADGRLSYVRNERNLGPQGNWNRCLDLAGGQYFKLLPHDDVLHPRCLERQRTVLDADPDQRVALVFSAREVIDADGRLLTRRGYPGGREGVIDAASIMSACVRRGTNLIGEPGAVLMRKSLADRIGPFDATNPYVIDLDYWVRSLAHGDAYYCSEALAGFRVAAGSWSVAIGSKQSSDFRQFVERMKSRDMLSVSTFDQCCGRLTPALNNLARLVFYRLYLR